MTETTVTDRQCPVEGCEQCLIKREHGTPDGDVAPATEAPPPVEWECLHHGLLDPDGHGGGDRPTPREILEARTQDA